MEEQRVASTLSITEDQAVRDISIEIFKFLDGKSLIHCLLACKTWYELIRYNDKYLWFPLVRNLLALGSVEKVVRFRDSWRTIYLMSYASIPISPTFCYDAFSGQLDVYKSAIPSEALASSNGDIKTVNVQGCRISVFPIEITAIVSITTLRIGYNELSLLPKELSRLTNLGFIFF